MSANIYIFKRVEKKYRTDKDTVLRLTEMLGDSLVPDIYPHNTVMSVYLDTPDRLIVRNSIDAADYKEKLRLRSYGVPGADTTVFLEIKRKYRGVVCKRREGMSLAQAENYLNGGEAPSDSQIMREFDYAMKLYRRPAPTAIISYERDAFVYKNMPEVRITFDSFVGYRFAGLDQLNGDSRSELLPQNEILIEIKTNGAMPLELAHALDRLKLYPTSFSKYENAYFKHLSTSRRD